MPKVEQWEIDEMEAAEEAKSTVEQNLEKQLAKAELATEKALAVEVLENTLAAIRSAKTVFRVSKTTNYYNAAIKVEIVKDVTGKASVVKQRGGYLLLAPGDDTE